MKFSTLCFASAGSSVVSAYTVTNVGRFMLKNIDPIVFPGQYVSHMHSFFGSDAVTVNTTSSKELQAGCSTAQNPNDYSSYCKYIHFPVGLGLTSFRGANALRTERHGAYRGSY